MNKKPAEQLNDSELDQVHGAGLLLPAVQKVRVSAAQKTNLKSNEQSADEDVSSDEIQRRDGWIEDGGDTNI